MTTDRKNGTGCVTQINDHLWEGKFSPKWPDGKKHSRSVYANTESECEEKLTELIRQMKTEIAQAMVDRVFTSIPFSRAVVTNRWRRS